MPLLEEAGIIGVLFFDAGNIYARGEEITFESLRFSAGPEIRWLSPVGPIRLAYGFILDPEPTDHGIGNWEFSMASLF
jgi:outer membrane protein insertion porin family